MYSRGQRVVANDTKATILEVKSNGVVVYTENGATKFFPYDSISTSYHI